MSAQLHVRANGREALFGSGVPEFVVGSARGCAVRVSGEGVAPQHALVRFVGGGWTLHPSAPVFHDGQAISTAAIQAPLIVRLGDPVSGPVLELAPAGSSVSDATVDYAFPPPRMRIRADPRMPATSFALTAGVLRIGRDTESDIVIDDLLVSRRHAEVRRVRDGRFEVVDVGSRNGTFVNGRRVTVAVLDDRDMVTIGRNSYRVIDDRLEEEVDSGEVDYAAVDLIIRLPDGTVLLDRASFALEPRSMLAVIGPSGSGKSTLLRALAGFRMADEGDVRYGELSLYANYEALRSRIGYVPQDDIVHPELTVAAALDFAADLRFPGDVAEEQRRTRVLEVLQELSLEHRRDTPVALLSGGERKRVSVGLELLTAPSLLFLDEPTSGLDPNYERSLMQQFRALADHGRTIVVATHSVASLRLCDRVAVLAPGGRLAYFGPPQLLLTYFKRDDHADVFRDLVNDGTTDWGAAFREHADRATQMDHGEPAPPRPEQPTAHPRGRWHQFTTLTRRYAAVVIADRRNLALLAAQAPVLGLLLLVALPGGELEPAPPDELRLVSQASLVLLVVVLAMSWLGMSNAVREIAKELPLFRRERAAGVSVVAYLGSKVCVLGVITILQAAVLVSIAMAAQDGPAHAVLLGWPVGELTAMAALIGLAAMSIGLLISAWAKTPDRASSLLPIVLVFMLVLALGGVFPRIGDKPVLKQLGYAASTRWGFPGMASTSDLNNLQAVTGVLTRSPSVDVDDPDALFGAFRRRYRGDPLWDHTRSAWLADAGALLGLSLVALLAAGLVLRREGGT